PQTSYHAPPGGGLEWNSLQIRVCSMLDVRRPSPNSEQPKDHSMRSDPADETYPRAPPLLGIRKRVWQHSPQQLQAVWYTQLHQARSRSRCAPVDTSRASGARFVVG